MTIVFLRVLAGVFLFSACSGAAVSKPAKLAASGAQITGHSIDQVRDSDEIRRLAQLWQSRMKDRSTGDYPIGAGDLFVVHVAGLDEYKDLPLRISPNNTGSLPYVGAIDVTGMTENGLREEISRRLEKDIIHNPQVTLFAKEAPSRQVAVIGAVEKPGLYNLSGSSDTVLGMISQAGGMKSNAAERLLFYPAEPVHPNQAKEVMATLPPQVSDASATPLVLKEVEPLVILLDSVNRRRTEMYLNMPARPGDVILVPGGGDVLVQGWVEKPGAYKITAGLTVLGAVAAAGGTMFPANQSAIELLRTDTMGRKMSLSVDLEGIKSGEKADIPLQEGDVVHVTASGPKLAAYGVYRFFTTIMHIGASFPLR
jgi:polysaccharide biosynthesis/export protein